MEGIRARGSKVEGEVDTKLLREESDGSNHGHTSVLDLGVLEPLDRFRAILKESSANGGAFIASLDRNTEGFVDGGTERGHLAGRRNIGRSECRGTCKEEGKSSRSLHGYGGSIITISSSFTEVGALDKGGGGKLKDIENRVCGNTCSYDESLHSLVSMHTSLLLEHVGSATIFLSFLFKYEEILWCIVGVQNI